MANATGRRMMAEIDGDFVVFLIGARFNTVHLPPFGLGKAGRLVPLTEGKTARQRFRTAATGAAD